MRNSHPLHVIISLSLLLLTFTIEAGAEANPEALTGRNPHWPIIHQELSPDLIDSFLEAHRSGMQAIENGPLVSMKKTTTEARAYFVRLKEKPTLRKAREVLKENFRALMKGQATATIQLQAQQVVLEQRMKIRSAQRALQKHLRRLGITETQLGRTVETLDNGFAIRDIDADKVKEIRSLPQIETVKPLRVYQAMLDESVELVRAPQVWTGNLEGGETLSDLIQPNRGDGITVGILDTGIDYTHPSLGSCSVETFVAGNCEKVPFGYDFINDDADPYDDHYHGTHVAGIVAGNDPARPELRGVAPDATLVGIKVLSAGGQGSYDAVIAGVEFAIDPNGDGDFSDHLDVINLSLGGPGDPDDDLSLKIDQAVSAGIVAVIAAGNSGPGEFSIRSPGTARHAITVGATYKKDEGGAGWDVPSAQDMVVKFSSRGSVLWDNFSRVLLKPDVVAPGVFICAAKADAQSTSYGDCPEGYTALSGTSMAAPHVAGLAALLVHAHPSWSPLEIKAAIKRGAIDVGQSPSSQGAGRVDAVNAILGGNQFEEINQVQPPAEVRLELLRLDSELTLLGTAKGSGFQDYVLDYREHSEDSAWLPLASSSQPVEEEALVSLNMDQLETALEYEFRLRVTDTLGESVDRVLFRSVSLLQPMPPEFTASYGDEFAGINLKFQRDPAAQVYWIYHMIDEENELIKLLGSYSNPSQDVFSYLQRPVAPNGRPVKFVATAINIYSGATSDFSEVEVGAHFGNELTPLAPTNVQATTHENGKIIVSWDAPSAGPEPQSYYIYMLPNMGQHHCEQLEAGNTQFKIVAASELSAEFVINEDSPSHYFRPGREYVFAVSSYRIDGGLSNCSSVAIGKFNLDYDYNQLLFQNGHYDASLPPPSSITASVGTESEGILVEFVQPVAPSEDYRYAIDFLPEPRSACDTGNYDYVSEAGYDVVEFPSTASSILITPDMSSQDDLTRGYISMRTMMRVEGESPVIPDDYWVYGPCSESVVFGAISPMPPAVPTELSATLASRDDGIELNWSLDSIGGAASEIEIYRTNISTDSFRCDSYFFEYLPTEPYQVIDASQSSFLDSDTSPGNQYFYSLRVRNADGISGCTPFQLGTRASISFEPAPTLNATYFTLPDTVELTWTEPVSDVRSYNIYRSTSEAEACSGEVFRGIPASLTGFSDSSATTDVTYFYSIEAVGAAGEVSPCSEIVQGGAGSIPVPETVLVFTTAGLYSSNFGSLENADAICQAEAAAAGLGGSFRAWISSSTVSAAERLAPDNPSTPRDYLRVDGALVATSWLDLTDGAILNPVKVAASGEFMNGNGIVLTYTGTNFDGSASIYSCNDWATEGPTGLGLSSLGNILRTDEGWTATTVSSCSQDYRLYCVEVLGENIEPEVCIGDVAPAGGGNGVVNLDDLLAVLDAVGSDCSDGCEADIAPAPDGNGEVNIDDIFTVTDNFGPCH